MKVTLHLQNYKKIRSLLAEFQSGHVYIVKASNNQGKTSFLQAFLSTLEARNPNKKALSFGAVEGSVTAKILDFKGIDDENYTIKFDMAKDKDDKFIIIRPDTTIGKKVSDITSVFKYNAFTVDDWFSWGKTAEGRRKQAKILLNLLPEASQKEFADIDARINTNSGTTFEERRKANAVYDSLSTAYNLIQFDANEIKMLDIGEKWNEESQALIQEKETTLKLLASSAPQLVHIETLKNTILRFDTDIERITNELATERESTAEQIKALEDRIAKLRTDLEAEEVECKSKIDGYTTAKTEAEAKLKQEEENIPKDLPKIEDIEARIAKRADFDLVLKTATEKQTKQKESKANLQKAFDLKESLTEKIEADRKRKLEIIQTAELPVSNIMIQSDEVLYIDETGNELPFSEDNVSYSRGGLIVAQIMLAINKDLPILMIGKSAEYDLESMDKLVELAAKNNACVILDKVEQAKTEEITIECYEGGKFSTTDVVNIVPDALKVKENNTPANSSDQPFTLNLPI